MNFLSYVHNSYRTLVNASVGGATHATQAQEHVLPVTDVKGAPCQLVWSSQKIGSGAFSDVFRGKLVARDQSKRVVAVKVTKFSRSGTSAALMRARAKEEVQCLLKLDHPNVLRLHAYVFSTSGNTLALALEYCAGGDLSELLRGLPAHRLGEPHAQRFLGQLAAALSHLFAHGIAHRDLKPANILLTTHNPDTAHIKLADFGFARELKPQSLANTICGSPLYMAPEIVSELGHAPGAVHTRGPGYSNSADLWSVGIIMYEMLCGRVAFPAATIDRLQTQLAKCSADIDVPSHVSDAPAGLLRALLQKDPTLRISWEEFVADEWLCAGQKRCLVATKPARVPSPDDDMAPVHCGSAPVSGSFMRHASRTLSHTLRAQNNTLHETDFVVLHSPDKNASSAMWASYHSQTWAHISSVYELAEKYEHASPTTVVPTRAHAVADKTTHSKYTIHASYALVLYADVLARLRALVQLDKNMKSCGNVQRMCKVALDMMHRVLTRVNVLQRRVTHDPAFRIGTAAKIIYDYALHAGRTGCVEEMYGRTDAALALFRESQALLQVLYTAARGNPDQQLLQRLIGLTARRMAGAQEGARNSVM